MHAYVRDIMTTGVVTVRPDTPYREIAAMFREHQVSGFPVTAKDGTVIGVVSESDLLALAAGRQHRGHCADDQATAGDLMTHPAVTIGPHDLVQTASVPATPPASSGPGTGNGNGASRSASPAIRSGSRLVARTRTSSHACSNLPHSAAAAPITCSQLPSTSSSCCWRTSTRASTSATGTPGCSRTPSATATTAGTCAPSCTGASSASHSPVGEPGRHPPGHRAGQPGLADPARPGHRHQPVLPQQPRHLAHRPGPADEAGQRGREAMHATSRGGRLGHPHARTITAGRSLRTARRAGRSQGCPPRTKRSSRRWSWPRSSGPRGAGRRQDRFGALV
jgi:hypothetical protein